MKIHHLFVLLFLLFCCSSSRAQNFFLTPEQERSEFSRTTNYMSWEGFERLKKFRDSRKWEKLRSRKWFEMGLFVPDAIYRRQKDKLFIALDSVAAYGDDNDYAHAVAHKIFAAFPTTQWCIVNVSGQCFGHDISFGLMLKNPQK